MKSNKNFICFINIIVVSFAFIFISSYLLFAKRSTSSALERRRLSEFPEFTLESYFSGEYTVKLQTWFTDTVPDRDTWKKADMKIRSLFGFASEMTIQGDVTETSEEEIPSGEVSDPFAEWSEPEESSMEERSSVIIDDSEEESSGEASQDVSEEPSDEPSKEESSEEISEEISTDPYAHLRNYDFEDDTVTFLVNGVGYGGRYMSVEIMSYEDNPEALNEAIEERNKTVEYLLDVRIDEVRSDDLKRDARNDINGGGSYDIFVPYMPDAAIFAAEGSLLDLNSVYDILDLDDPSWDQAANNEFSFADKLYFTTGDFSLLTFDCTYCIVFNKTLASKCGADDMYELLRTGKWTFDAMHRNAKLATADTDGKDGMTYLTATDCAAAAFAATQASCRASPSESRVASTALNVSPAPVESTAFTAGAGITSPVERIRHPFAPKVVTTSAHVDAASSPRPTDASSNSFGVKIETASMIAFGSFLAGAGLKTIFTP